MRILVNDEIDKKPIQEWFDTIDKERFEDYIDEFHDLFEYDLLWTNPNEGEEDFEIEYMIEPKDFLKEIYDKLIKKKRKIE